MTQASRTARGPELPPIPAGWTPVELPFSDNRGPSFVSGDPDGNRFRIHYFRREADGALVGWVWFGPGAQGPPGKAHGGSVAAVMDEAMGIAAWVAGYPVVAARITVEFLHMMPLEQYVMLEAWVRDTAGKKVHPEARLVDGAGQALARSDGVFVAIDRERFVELADQARAQPPADVDASKRIDRAE